MRSRSAVCRNKILRGFRFVPWLGISTGTTRRSAGSGTRSGTARSLGKAMPIGGIKRPQRGAKPATVEMRF